MYEHTHCVINCGCLSQDAKPKESISLLDLNVTLNGISGRPNVMQMTALVRGRTRNYFVYSDNSQVWYGMSLLFDQCACVYV